MVKKFDEIIGQFPHLMDMLNDSDFVDRNQLKNEKGIYVFYENDAPQYVGRTRNLKRRLNEHGK